MLDSGGIQKGNKMWSVPSNSTHTVVKNTKIENFYFYCVLIITCGGCYGSAWQFLLNPSGFLGKDFGEVSGSLEKWINDSQEKIVVVARNARCISKHNLGIRQSTQRKVHRPLRNSGKQTPGSSLSSTAPLCLKGSPTTPHLPSRWPPTCQKDTSQTFSQWFPIASGDWCILLPLVFLGAFRQARARQRPHLTPRTHPRAEPLLLKLYPLCTTPVLSLSWL